MVHKRLIVCCDGTWYASDKGSETLPSNVAKLSRSLAKVAWNDKTAAYDIPQIVYYQAGVGTGALAHIDKYWQGAFGTSLDENVAEAYNFLSTNWSRGDEIFLFGFSRGAYTARAVAGLICEVGLIKKRYMNMFPGMYKAYREREGQKLEDTTWGKETYKHLGANRKIKTNWEVLQSFVHKDIKIKAIGVWDTVGSLGLPDSSGVTHALQHINLYKNYHQFHDTRLSSKIENAFHALALDERRGTFVPTMWYIGKPNENGEYPNLKQCWFPGYHSDVGGGTVDGTKDETEIDEIAFAWMLDQLYDLLQFSHMSIHEFLLDRKATWNTSKDSDDSYTWSYVAAGGGQTRHPGAIFDDVPAHTLTTEVKDCQTRIKTNKSTEGITNECIHPSVWHRIQSRSESKLPPYCPRGMPMGPKCPNCPWVGTCKKHYIWERIETKGQPAKWVQKDQRSGNTILELPEYSLLNKPCIKKPHADKLDESIWTFGGFEAAIAPSDKWSKDLNIPSRGDCDCNPDKLNYPKRETTFPCQK